MKLSVSKPYDNWAQFPKSNIPVVPIIDYHRTCAFHNNDKKINSTFLKEQAIYVHSGRYALATALDIMEINSNDSVLMPSYHCLSMIAPVVWSRANLKFYKLNNDLSININDLKNKISSATKAIIVVHFFGFPQKLSKLKQICEKHSILLIEDCAHAFFGYSGARLPGTTGDFAISSLKKFFPVTDGGILINNRSAKKKIIQHPIGIIQQLKYTANLFEESMFYNRFKLLNLIFNIFQGLNILRKRPNGKIQTLNFREEISDELKIKTWLDPALKAKKISCLSKFVMKHADIDYICAKRRQNFLYMLNHLNDLKTVTPLFLQLKQDVIPYMFPLILKNPETDFKKLKQKKIPLWRWEELCITDCKTSRYFSKHLIQLPCHQSLKEYEIDRIIQTIREL